MTTATKQEFSSPPHGFTKTQGSRVLEILQRGRALVSKLWTKEAWIFAGSRIVPYEFDGGFYERKLVGWDLRSSTRSTRFRKPMPLTRVTGVCAIGAVGVAKQLIKTNFVTDDPTPTYIEEDGEDLQLAVRYLHRALPRRWRRFSGDIIDQPLSPYDLSNLISEFNEASRRRKSDVVALYSRAITLLKGDLRRVLRKGH